PHLAHPRQLKDRASTTSRSSTTAPAATPASTTSPRWSSKGGNWPNRKPPVLSSYLSIKTGEDQNRRGRSLQHSEPLSRGTVHSGAPIPFYCRQSQIQAVPGVDLEVRRRGFLSSRGSCRLRQR